MRNHGVSQFGWKSVTEQQAQAAANEGKLAVVMWKTPARDTGHVAVVRPGSLTDKGAAIGQAGRHNFN